MCLLKLRPALLCVALWLSAAAASGAEAVKIRVSWIAPVTNWASILLEKKELARHLGGSYVLEPVRYVGTPQMITALANGELEIANLAFSTLPIAIENAGLDDLRVIADELQDGVPGYYSQEYMVLADGAIGRIEISRARSLRRWRREPPSTSPCAPCCAGTDSRTSATTPWWKRRCPPCAPCSRSGKWI